MSFPSAELRPAAFDVTAAVGIAVVAFGISRLLRSYFPTPSGTAWLWACSILGVLAAYGLSMKHNMTALRWAMVFSITYLGLQIVLQLVSGLRIIDSKTELTSNLKRSAIPTWLC